MAELGGARFVGDRVARVRRERRKLGQGELLDRPSFLGRPDDRLTLLAARKQQRQEAAHGHHQAEGGYPAIVNGIRILSAQPACSDPQLDVPAAGHLEHHPLQLVHASASAHGDRRGRQAVAVSWHVSRHSDPGACEGAVLPVEQPDLPRVELLDGKRPWVGDDGVEEARLRRGVDGAGAAARAAGCSEKDGSQIPLLRYAARLYSMYRAVTSAASEPR